MTDKTPSPAPQHRNCQVPECLGKPRCEACIAMDLRYPAATRAPAPAVSPSNGWTGNSDADQALILLDRLDCDVGDDSVRIEQLEQIVRKLAAATVSTAPAHVNDIDVVESFTKLTGAPADHATVEHWETALTAVMPADFKDWHANSRREWPDIAAHVISNLRQREDEAWAAVERLSAPAPATDKESLTVADAMTVVIHALQDDPGYAWSWHCNIAMAAVDEGVDHGTANHAAARFMRLLASVEPAHKLPPKPVAQAEHKRPLFAARVAQQKFDELLADGYRMESITFANETRQGTIDPWGVVRWDHGKTASPVAEHQKPAFWVLKDWLEARETTCNGRMWFSDPQNSAWTPLYTAPQVPAPLIGSHQTSHSDESQPAPQAPQPTTYGSIAERAQAGKDAGWWAPQQADHVPVTAEQAQEVDDALGLVALPPIRVSKRTSDYLDLIAKQRGLIVQAVVRELLEPGEIEGSGMWHPKPLPAGWKFNHARQAEEPGIWEIGWLENEDDSFSPIITVDTGLYYQDQAAGPLARAILDRLAEPDTPGDSIQEGGQ